MKMCVYPICCCLSKKWAQHIKSFLLMITATLSVLIMTCQQHLHARTDTHAVRTALWSRNLLHNKGQTKEESSVREGQRSNCK